MGVTLTVNDPRFALQGIAVETDRTPGSKQVTMPLAPAQIITGRVTYADTGRPVARGRIEVGGSGRTEPTLWDLRPMARDSSG